MSSWLPHPTPGFIPPTDGYIWSEATLAAEQAAEHALLENRIFQALGFGGPIAGVAAAVYDVVTSKSPRSYVPSSVSMDTTPKRHQRYSNNTDPAISPAIDWKGRTTFRQGGNRLYRPSYLSTTGIRTAEWPRSRSRVKGVRRSKRKPSRYRSLV